MRTPYLDVLKRIKPFEFKPGITSFLNPHSFNLIIDDQSTIDGIDQWYVDGISLVQLNNLLMPNKIQRFSFDETSLASFVFNKAKELNLKIALIGTKEELIAAAAKKIELKYNIEIEYYRNGYFSTPEEYEKAFKLINEKKINLIICGMGTPKQESFLINLKKTGWTGYGFTCGGFLHQISDSTDYYPSFYDKLEIRWLYRIFKEPKLIKRYAILYPKFFIKILSEFTRQQLTLYK
ncbi:WecB/TagA/CpsF family glycosyltransferase [Arcticibacterium luteifluviistationis]|uniref:Glycosyltransferase n=1 Tax=Arcticibacterium luteifluviistationis TaxID=1784714 RepID=A0A2Z4GAC1_9BACT|nr:WecB/TagA/CpsF family glycosyltransferase [Arcticibacterium luteifluviistationis]AWV98040.1 glycosyltransferase [Arcticibacterium luteifluviistationis]